MSPAGGFAPALNPGSFEPEQVQDPAQALVDQLGDGLRFGIKGGHRRSDDRAHLRQCRQGSQMAGMKRRFTHHEDEAAAFLEHDVRRAAQ